MPVIAMNAELVRSLDVLLLSYWLHRHVGLYQNDWTPASYQTISAVEPAVFSGYNGTRPISGSTAAAIVGVQAVASYPEQVWAHNGGPDQCYVYGIYVVDDSGALCWAERVWDPPIPMFGAGQVIRYRPRLALQSIFPTW